MFIKLILTREPDDEMESQWLFCLVVKTFHLKVVELLWRIDQYGLY